MEGLRSLLGSRNFIWKYCEESLECLKLGNYMFRFVLENALGLYDEKFIHSINIYIEGLPCAKYSSRSWS